MGILQRFMSVKPQRDRSASIESVGSHVPPPPSMKIGSNNDSTHSPQHQLTACYPGYDQANSTMLGRSSSVLRTSFREVLAERPLTHAEASKLLRKYEMAKSMIAAQKAENRSLRAQLEEEKFRGQSVRRAAHVIFQRSITLSEFKAANAYKETNDLPSCLPLEPHVFNEDNPCNSAEIAMGTARAGMEALHRELHLLVSAVETVRKLVKLAHFAPYQDERFLQSVDSIANSMLEELSRSSNRTEAARELVSKVAANASWNVSEFTEVVLRSLVSLDEQRRLFEGDPYLSAAEVERRAQHALKDLMLAVRSHDEHGNVLLPELRHEKDFASAKVLCEEAVMRTSKRVALMEMDRREKVHAIVERLP